MTKKETLVLLGYLKIAYPNMLKDNDVEFTGNVWHEILCDEEIILARLALKKHVAKNKYPPSISELLKLIESEKWTIYSENAFCMLSDDEEPPRRLPNCFVPRSITHEPKQFEKQAQVKIDEIVDIKSRQLEADACKQIT